MSKKKKENDKEQVKVTFLGTNASGVTGSMTLISFMDKNILLEFGMFQDGTVLETYNTNMNMINQLDCSNIDICIVCHAHIDHSGLVPALYRRGFRGRIITTHITAQLLYPLLQDSAHIIKKDAEYLSSKKGYKVEPLYEGKDVFNTMDLIYEYGCDKIFKINDNISFRLLHNNHIIGACSLELFFKNSAGRVQKLFYSSDMGNPLLQKPFVDELEYCSKANLAIIESTYGNASRNITKQDRKNDIKKMKSLINDVVIKGRHQILIPCFSLDRTQHLLKLLYDVYHEDPNFDDEIQVIIDSHLSMEITKVYKSVLEDENLDIIKTITSWKNVKFISNFNETMINVKEDKPKIILSASGFLDKGHSNIYLQEYLPNPNNAILFVGYASPKSLSGKLREEGRKYLKIGDKNFKVNAKIETLISFSSHIQKEQLLNYIKMINAGQIILVHGEKEAKSELYQSAKEELSKINKTTQVTIAQRGMSIKL